MKRGGGGVEPAVKRKGERLNLCARECFSLSILFLLLYLLCMIYNDEF